jgi:predicted HTH transcriptional regulator
MKRAADVWQMNQYETIAELLNAPEGEHYQFKEAKSRYNCTDAVKICCALANRSGGKLVFGITDKRPRLVIGSKAFEQAELVFEYRSKETAGPAAQREEFRNGFFNYYDRIGELVNLRNEVQHYQEGFHVFGISTFNERAS